ncbi:hypothetical protein [Geobacillus stearothermophilus]|nr:hypothetical protein [Geobacillus stearothermophilus]MDF9297468.1 hypothetical protein [Geobacillus stearothermophilus]
MAKRKANHVIPGMNAAKVSIQPSTSEIFRIQHQ